MWIPLLVTISLDAWHYRLQQMVCIAHIQSKLSCPAAGQSMQATFIRLHLMQVARAVATAYASASGSTTVQVERYAIPEALRYLALPCHVGAT